MHCHSFWRMKPIRSQEADLYFCAMRKDSPFFPQWFDDGDICIILLLSLPYLARRGNTPGYRTVLLSIHIQREYKKRNSLGLSNWVFLHLWVMRGTRMEPNEWTRFFFYRTFKMSFEMEECNKTSATSQLGVVSNHLALNIKALFYGTA